MRLIDQILYCTKKQDEFTGGALMSLRGLLWRFKPQCFEMDKSVEQAAIDVCVSRPSSVLSALCYARLPYPIIWVERNPWPNGAPAWDGDTEKPVPVVRVGSLIVNAITPEEQPPGTSCMAIWAFGYINGMIGIAPYSVLFNWYRAIKEPHEVGPLMRGILAGRFPSYVSDEKERDAALLLGGHELLAICPLTRKYWEARGFPVITNGCSLCVKDSHGEISELDGYALDQDNISKEQRRQFAAVVTDMVPENLLVTGFMLLLNSRNALEHEREDLQLLNKARKKKGKPPLESGFIKTRLLIPRHLNQVYGYSDAERAQARLHMVRGHFKVRKTGVFWWTPHPRGKGHPEVKRESYSVHTASQ